MVVKIKVLVVDDSALVRKAITDALSMDPNIEVVGSASDPLFAMEKIPRLQPDVMTLDMEMPRMDGLTFLRKLKSQGSKIKVIVISSLTQQGSQIALDAIEAGAVDVLAKPDGQLSIRSGSVCLNSFGRFAKWISASIMPPPSLVPARCSRPDPASAGQGMNVGVGYCKRSDIGQCRRGPQTRSCRRGGRPPRI